MILMKLPHLLYDPHEATAPSVWSSWSYRTYCKILFIFATKPLWSHPHEATTPTVWSWLYSQQNLFDPILMKLPHLLYDPHAPATAPTLWSSWFYRTYCMILMKLPHLLYDPHAPATAPTVWSSWSYHTYCMILFIFATKPLWSHPHESTEPTVLLGALFTDS